MSNTRFQEQLKTLLDEIRNETLPTFLDKDTSYQECCKKLDHAEREYMQLKLTDEQRKIIDNYLFLLDENNTDYSTSCYLTGLCDNHKFSSIFTCNSTNSPKQESILKNLFNGNLFVTDDFSESQESRQCLKELYEEENPFIASLNSDQKALFDKIFDKRIEYHSFIFDDAFYYGFQLGVKILLDVFS
jgi:hypothetical protein